MNPDVAVVGGGAIGASVALELARRGARVVLLDRGPELAAGCSAGNAGLICPSHARPLAGPAALRKGLRDLLRPDSPFRIHPRPSLAPWLARFALACTAERERAATALTRRLCVASLELHAELAALGTGFERRGILNVYETARAFAAGQAEAAASGLRHEVLGPKDVRALEPAVSALAGAALYPDEAHCDPFGFVQAVGRAAAEAGAELRLRTEVLGLRRRGARVEALETTAGPVAAGEVVLAAGAWTPQLARDLPVPCPVEGGKGYHVDLEPGPGDPRLPVFLQEARVVATPLPGRLRLAGTLELCGLDLSVDRRRVEAIETAGRRGVRGLEGRRVLEVWRGLRPCTPDGLPILGRPEGIENVVLATGHAMLGLTLAPVTGRLVAGLVGGEQPGRDLAALSPDRFRRPFGTG